MSVCLKKFDYVKFDGKYLLFSDIVVTTVAEANWMKNELKKLQDENRTLKLLLEKHLKK